MPQRRPRRSSWKRPRAPAGPSTRSTRTRAIRWNARAGSRPGERVDADEFSQLRFVAVIEARVLQRLEHLVGADGEHGGAAPAGDVAEGIGEKGLADADGAVPSCRGERSPGRLPAPAAVR